MDENKQRGAHAPLFSVLNRVKKEKAPIVRDLLNVCRCRPGYLCFAAIVHRYTLFIFFVEPTYKR